MNYIKSLILLMACIITVGAAAQNVNINVLTQNSGQVFNGATVFIEVAIGNTDGSLSVPQYKLRPLISVPSAIVNVAATGHVLPTGWSVLTSTAGTIRISNGTDQIPPNTSRTVLIAVQGVSVGGPSTVSGNIAFSNGVAPGSASGTATTGDNTADNSSTSTVEVLPAPACNLSVTASAGSISCNGGTTTLTASATGANGSVEYSLNGGAYQSSNSFTVNAAGSPYTVTAREVSNPSCTANSTAVTVTQPSAISASADAGSVLCNGGTATLTVTASGGTGSLQYSLNAGTFQSGNTFTVNAAGSPYTVTVRDANLCTSGTNSVTVSEPTAVIGNAAVSSAIAAIGGTGAITVTGSGGTGTYSYAIVSGPTTNTTGATSGVFSGLQAGNYTFSVTDANNCSVTTSSVTLSEGACTLSVSAAAGTILCAGGTATLTATASGAPGSVEYSLNGGTYQSSNTFTVLAGSYTVTARLVSSPSCNATSSNVTVTQPLAISAAATAGSIACNGGSTSLTVTASGGTGSLEYSLNGGTYQSSNAFTVNGAASPYTVTVRDANLCTANSNAVTVTVPAAVPVPVITSTNNGNNTFTLTASGFTGSLLWSTSETTASILVSVAGTYTVTQTVGSCTSAAASQTVTLGNAIADPAVGQMFITNLSDVVQSAGSLLFTQNYKLKAPVYNLNQFTAVPSSSVNFRINLGTKLRLEPSYNLATAPLSQYFSFAAAIVADSQIITGTQIADLPADFDGTAVFEVKGVLSCTSNISSAFVITNSSASLTDEDLNNNNATLQYNLPVTVSATAQDVTCFGAADGTITVTASPGTTVVITNASSTVVTAPFGPGTYTVTATATGDAPQSNTCTNSTVVTIAQPLQLSLTLVGTTPSLCNGGNTGTVSVSAAGGNGGYAYTISGPTINTTGATNGVFTGLSAGSYVVTVTDAKGCNSTVNASVSQPTGSAPDLSLGSDITGSLFAGATSSQTIVYNISEIGGNAAVGDTLRITRVAGFDISFDDALTSTLIAPTTYTLDNVNWKIDNTNPAFVSIIKKAAGGLPGPGVLNCTESVKIAITLSRNTSNISTFPLSARLRRANGELNLSNNFNSIIFAAE